MSMRMRRTDDGKEQRIIYHCRGRVCDVVSAIRSKCGEDRMNVSIGSLLMPVRSESRKWFHASKVMDTGNIKVVHYFCLPFSSVMPFQRRKTISAISSMCSRSLLLQSRLTSNTIMLHLYFEATSRDLDL